MKKICGIYQILSKINLKKYDGKSKNIEGRWKKHKSQLRNNKHFNEHLQNAWKKYGEENFEFIILKECPKEELKYWEEYYINLDESYDREKGYNIRTISEGVETCSIETRQKLSESHKGRYNGENNPFYGKKHSKETKIKLSESRKGEKNPASKLTWEQVREIRQKYIPKKYGYRKLAKEYNIDRGHVRKIILNRKWKIEGENK